MDTTQRLQRPHSGYRTNRRPFYFIIEIMRSDGLAARDCMDIETDSRAVPVRRRLIPFSIRVSGPVAGHLSKERTR
jgi:hypothetical protein